MAWGNSGKTAEIPQVNAYNVDPNDPIRAGVALALGKLIEGKTVNREVEQAIACLGTLSRDRAACVRQKAIQALGKTRSQAVIPFLQRALHDCDPDVMSLASAMIQNYKHCAIAPSQKTLPKNSAARNISTLVSVNPQWGGFSHGNSPKSDSLAKRY